jgi:transposase
MARTGRPKQLLVLEPAEREQLQRWARRPKTEQRRATRSRIVLRCADGLDNDEVAAELGLNEKTVAKWRRRFVERRLDGLADDPRPGVPRTVLDEKVEEIVRRTIEEQPLGATHWSTRSLAARVGVSPATVGRIWQAFGLRPHLLQTFKLSSDPLFVAKVRDVVRLYLDPPERALVLCVDEKSQIQALERSQPLPPLLRGTPARMSHDHKRHGTTSLFAALDVASGKGDRRPARPPPRARVQEVPRPARARGAARTRAAPDSRQLRDAQDADDPTLAAAPPRFVLHFVPKSACWLNLVERWFAAITTKLPRRGVHRSVAELETDMRNWLTHWNENPRPYVWVKTADEILSNLA